MDKGGSMRGSDRTTGSLFSYVDIEARIPAKHPLRPIRRIVNDVLAGLDAELAALYEPTGRDSIPPERLLRGALLQTFYSIRSERQLMEQLDYNLLYRWFVGLGIDDAVWDHSVYSKNRDRLLDADIARLFLKGILEHPEVAPLLSSDHFSVDGTLVTAWASLKSLAPRPDGRSDGDGNQPPGGTAGVGTQPHSDAGSKPEPTQDSKPMQNCDTSARSRNGEVDFHGQKRSNATHVSTTDPEARLFRKGKGKEARLSYMGHALAENRHGLIVEASLTPATGTAEREAAKDLVESHSPGSERRLTLGADKAYDTRAFVADCRAMCVTPHVAQNTTGRASAIDARTTRHAGYAVSQRKRKLIEEAFGWAKTVGGLGRPMRRGTARMAFLFTFTMAAYDLIRLPKLLPAAA
jgi:transposase